MELKEDRYFINKVLAGEVNAFTFLVDKYKSMAYTLAVRLLRDKEEAEEVAQDAFVKAYKNLKGFKGKSKFSTWLYSIVYNTAISRLRRQKHEMVQIEDTQIANTEFGDTRDAYYLLQEEERKKYIHKILQALEEEESYLVTLYYYEENSLDEIASITGMTKNNIKVKIFRARKKMQELLKQYLNKELINIL